MTEIDISCAKQFITAPEKSTVIHVLAKRKPFYIERYYWYEGEKIPAPNVPYKMQETVGKLDRFGKQTLFLLLPKQCEVEYVPGICLEDIDDDINQLYLDLDVAIRLCAKDLGKHFSAIQKKLNTQNKPKTVDPKLLDARKKLHDEIEALIDQLQQRQQAYENRSLLGKTWANAKAIGAGIGTGITEYLPDLGPMGELMDEIGIGSFEMMQAIYTGDIAELKQKIDAWKTDADENVEQAAAMMESILLLISDQTTREMLLGLPERVFAATPTDEAVEIGTALGTQWALDGGATTGAAMACGPGAAVCGLVVFSATSVRKAGKLLEPMAKVLSKLAAKIKQKKNKGTEIGVNTDAKNGNSSAVKVDHARGLIDLQPYVKIIKNDDCILFSDEKVQPGQFEIGMKGRAVALFKGSAKLIVKGEAKIYTNRQCTSELSTREFDHNKLKDGLQYFIRSTKTELKQSEKIEISLELKGKVDVGRKR